ncbi:MAG: hypothetical protein ACI9U0_000923 [Flavobacteriales bacterium]|jgi:hypothetical protein|tara:strand:- start:4252 stop:4866 length:615 start_codon:yes stop_codon:yes gene_type:complete
MKKIIIPFLSFLILASCDSEPIENSGEPNLITPINDEHSPALNKVEKNLNAFNDNLTAFIDCKSGSSSPSSCKEYIAKSISEYYGISDLMEAGNYIDYDKIPDKIAELDSWEKIGDFTEKNIQTALKMLNKFEKPVLIFNENDSYVHVVALKPNGSLSKSRKWDDISVPSCISYFPTRANKSFTNKGINYAFESSDGLVIWTKK